MNFLGISLPVCSRHIPREAPPKPPGAPTRVGEWRLLVISAPAVPLIAFACASKFHPTDIALASVALAGALILATVHLWHYYDSIGWYTRREVTSPELPLEIQEYGEKIVFGHEGVTFSNFLRGNRTLSYDQILGVQTVYQAGCLAGVNLSLTRHTYYNSKARPGHIPDDGNGKRTRTVLAILRLKAPHATFSGPQWIEEGWVPRLGFIRAKQTIN